MTDDVTRRGFLEIVGGIAGAALVVKNADGETVDTLPLTDDYEEMTEGLPPPEPPFPESIFHPHALGTVEILDVGELLACDRRFGAIHVRIEPRIDATIMELKPFGPPRVFKFSKLDIGGNVQYHAAPIQWKVEEFHKHEERCCALALYNPGTWVVFACTWLGQFGLKVGKLGDVNYSWNDNGIASLDL